MRNEISQKDVPWPEGASGDSRGDRQGESDRMIWAAAHQGWASLLLQGIGSRDVSGPWALASSHGARQRSECSDALQVHVTKRVLVYSALSSRDILALGTWASLPLPFGFFPINIRARMRDQNTVMSLPSSAARPTRSAAAAVALSSGSPSVRRGSRARRRQG